MKGRCETGEKSCTLVLFKKTSSVIMPHIFAKTYNVCRKKPTVISLNFVEAMGKSSFTHPLKCHTSGQVSMTVSETSRSEHVSGQYSSNRAI